MEVNQILYSDVLDIIFEGRNKDYGAYELRKTYNKRLASAMVLTGGMLIIIISVYVLSNSFSVGSLQSKETGDVRLVELKTEPMPEYTPPPKSRPDIIPVKTISNTPPLIVNYDNKSNFFSWQNRYPIKESKPVKAKGFVPFLAMIIPLLKSR